PVAHGPRRTHRDGRRCGGVLDHLGGDPMTEQEFTAVVIDRLARIETGITALSDKIDKLTDTTGKHDDTLARHEARLLLLESRKGGWKVALGIASGLVAIA